MRKLWVIAAKEMYLRFTSPPVLLLTVGVPVVISILLGLSFGGLAFGRGILDVAIPVAIVNQDKGGPLGRLGDDIVQGLLSQSSGSAFSLFSVRQVRDVEAALELLDRDDVVGVLVIPSTFSQDMLAGDATLRLSVVSTTDVRAIAFQEAVEALADAVSTQRILVQTAVSALMAHPPTRARLSAGLLNPQLLELQAQAAKEDTSPIQVTRVTPPAVQVSLLRYFAGALAIFFAGLTSLMTSAALLQEQTQGTIRRALMTPTSLPVILGGNALGAFINGVLQMVVLLAAMSVVETLTRAGGQEGVRVDLLGLVLLIPATVLAATGFGVLVAGAAPSRAHVAAGGRGLLIAMGLLGGIFFPADLLPSWLHGISRCTYHYWAMDAYLALVQGQILQDIVLHLAVLGGMGLLLFTAGWWLTQRRFRWQL